MTLCSKNWMGEYYWDSRDCHKPGTMGPWQWSLPATVLALRYESCHGKAMPITGYINLLALFGDKHKEEAGEVRKMTFRYGVSDNNLSPLSAQRSPVIIVPAPFNNCVRSVYFIWHIQVGESLSLSLYVREIVSVEWNNDAHHTLTITRGFCVIENI